MPDSSDDSLMQSVARNEQGAFRTLMQRHQPWVFSLLVAIVHNRQHAEDLTQETETMRLYPPVPSVGREALTDCEIGGYRVPKGAQIAVVPWMTHRDKRWFGEDADKFRPERWDNDLAKRLPRCAYYPFVDGPRICIGMHFAMMEAVLVLATVASRYRLESAPGYTLKLISSVTLRPQGGMPMILHRRHGRHPLAEASMKFSEVLGQPQGDEERPEPQDGDMSRSPQVEPANADDQNISHGQVEHPPQGVHRR
jgi:hypothetical protein